MTQAASQHDDLIMICTSDIAGQVRGKAIPKSALDARREIGVGWTPTNVFITSFGPIAPSPWGAIGDLILRPDLSTRVELDAETCGFTESFILGDILQLDGTRWDCCLRGQLRNAAEQLESKFGLRLSAAFEHEFFYSGVAEQPGLGYGLRSFRRQGEFGNRLLRALAAAGLEPDTFMPEYGPAQFEVTVKPKPAVRAADEAVILRELTRATARSMGARASFSPIRDPASVGNGVHVHFSLQDSKGTPVNYDAKGLHSITPQAGAFVAGIVKYMPELLALTASAVTSYLRLTPHRWSAAFNNLGLQDREAGLRICPVFKPDQIAQQFHFEYRAADAAASPYLLLAAIVQAGLAGLREQLTVPTPTQADLSEWNEAALIQAGIQRLPQSLAQALERLEASTALKQWFGATLIDAFLRHKRCELELMQALDPAERCARYNDAY